MSYLSMRMREIRAEEERRENPYLYYEDRWGWNDWLLDGAVDFRKEQPFPPEYVSYLGRGA